MHPIFTVVSDSIIINDRTPSKHHKYKINSLKIYVLFLYCKFLKWIACGLRYSKNAPVFSSNSRSKPNDRNENESLT